MVRLTNITPIYWEFNGLSLHTGAWAIDTFGGARYKPAPKRGEDLLVPMSLGRSVTKKTRDSRTESLRMWLYDRNQDGSVDPDITPEQKLHENWEIFLDAISTDSPAPFVKRWWGGPTGEDVMVATGTGEVLEFPEPTSKGKLQRFQLDVYMADPWFYGSPVVENEGVINLLGNETTTKVVFNLTVTGPARVEMSDDNWFEYLGGAGNLIVDTTTGLSTLGGIPVNGMMRRNFDFWKYAEFDPKAGPLTVDFVSGISAGTITYSPAYH